MHSSTLNIRDSRPTADAVPMLRKVAVDANFCEVDFKIADRAEGRLVSVMSHKLKALLSTGDVQFDFEGMDEEALESFVLHYHNKISQLFTPIKHGKQYKNGGSGVQPPFAPENLEGAYVDHATDGSPA